MFFMFKYMDTYNGNPVRTAKQEGFWRAEVKAWEHVRLDHIRAKPIILGEDYEEYLYQVESLKDGNKKSYALVTINFPSDATVELVEPTIGKALQKIWISDFAFSWEFHHKDESWSHPHIHILLNRKNISKSVMIREFANTFKHVISDHTKVDVKLISVKDYEKTYKYITKNREADVKYRKLHNLWDVYRKGQGPYK